jgi:hypothetical protein
VEPTVFAEGDEDDGNQPAGTLAEPPAPSTAVALSESTAVPSVSTATQRSRANGTPRLRTRLFAARCLLDVPAAVGCDPRHFDASLLGEGSRTEAGDWLLLQLPQLIDIGFKMATGQVEALRSLGLRLLKVCSCEASSMQSIRFAWGGERREKGRGERV